MKFFAMPAYSKKAHLKPYYNSNYHHRDFQRCTIHDRIYSSGMTRIQLLILITLAALIAVLSVPPWLEYRKVSRADNDVEMIATEIKKFFKRTGEYPRELENLITDPGIEGWQASSLESIPETPWGGRYQILHDSRKVCIPANQPRIPQKYRLGEIAEISRVYLEGERAEEYWW